MSVIDELRHRSLYRVGAAYALLGYLLVQLAGMATPLLGLPGWLRDVLLWVAIIGFPIVVFIAWAFEPTPVGGQLDPDSDGDGGPARQPGIKLDMALLALLSGVISLITWNFLHPDTAADPTSVVVDSGIGTADHSIVVLPLVDRNADGSNSGFADSVHETVLDTLSGIDDLRVVSRRTALRYSNTALTPAEVCQQLGVRYVVAGSVRRVEDHVRVTVELTDGHKDTRLWASNFDHRLESNTTASNDVALAISNSLQLEIRPQSVGQLDEMPTQSVLAYDLYMKALSIDRSMPESEHAFREQRRLLEAAVMEDPDFVEAWGFLNETLDHMARNVIQNRWFGYTRTQRERYFADVRATAEHALERAIALEPDNVETLLAQASDFVNEQRDPAYQIERKAHIDRAIELYPDNAMAWLVLGWWYRIEGDMDSATPAFARALELDPLHTRIVMSSLIHFRLNGDEDMTSKLFERAELLAPEQST